MSDFRSRTFEQDIFLVVRYLITMCDNNVGHIYNEVDTSLGIDYRTKNGKDHFISFQTVG